MKRRELIKLLSASGVLLANPFGLSAPVAAAECHADHSLWVTIAAKGAWDPASLFDPKGDVDITGSGPVNSYAATDIRHYGNIAMSPYVLDRDNDRFEPFFSRHYSDILIINGIETGTNNHLTGEKHMWTGRIDDFYPCFAASVASSRNTTLPLAFLSSGYYDRTGGLVAKSRLSANPTSLFEIAQPNKAYPLDPKRHTQSYYDQAIFNTVQQAQNEKLKRQMAQETLPNKLQSMQMLRQARLGTSQLSDLFSKLPDELDDSSNPFLKQIQVCCASFAAGLSSTANLEIGQFDSHIHHDQIHYTNAARLFNTIEFLLQEAERQGIRERLNIVVGSDFGRTPWYNAQGGKDHWSTTSMMFLGPLFRGNRVLGATDDAMVAQKVNTTTFAPDDHGIIITPRLINHQLRRLACVLDSIEDKYPLALSDAELNADSLFI